MASSARRARPTPPLPRHCALLHLLVAAMVAPLLVFLTTALSFLSLLRFWLLLAAEPRARRTRRRPAPLSPAATRRLHSSSAAPAELRSISVLSRHPLLPLAAAPPARRAPPWPDPARSSHTRSASPLVAAGAVAGGREVGLTCEVGVWEAGARWATGTGGEVGGGRRGRRPGQIWAPATPGQAGRRRRGGGVAAATMRVAVAGATRWSGTRNRSAVPVPG
uniref:Uncharacterized protein n=1 Tax=Arundo donax TaxID=35708 RepID=A0A0A9AJS5_ARUDO